jgi:phenylacetate-CoA ligase
MLARYLFNLYRLRRNLSLAPAKLQEIQNKQLRVMVKHAYEKVPFYHRKLHEAKIKPGDIRSVEDLSKAPVTTKTEIQASPLENLVARNININRCAKTTTSGSTGMPLTVASDEIARDFRDALWTRARLENGLRIRDKMAIIKNPLYYEKHGGMFRFFRRKYISIFDDVPRQLALLEDYKPDVIRGYPSSLTILAESCRQKRSCLRPRLVFTGAELLEKRHRETISSVFECEVFDHYASVEFGPMAWECSEHAGYHMNVESVAIEFLDDGEVVGPGERGEIVCTNLHNHVMPLIRYRLDDVGIPAEEQCSCGRTLPLMKMLVGRTDDLLTALDGKLVYASSFFYNLFCSSEEIRQFRVIQERRDKLRIQLVVREGLLNVSEFLEKARIEIPKVFGEGMNVDFQLIDKIERDPSGKLRMIHSQVTEKSLNNKNRR